MPAGGSYKSMTLSTLNKRIVANLVEGGTMENLLKYAQLEFEVFNSELVRKAADSAIQENQGKKLLHGRARVIDYLICTAVLLASSCNSDAVVAVGLLLHDSLFDTKPQYKALRKEFGSEVAKLVRDVSKLSKLSKISREKQLGNSERMVDLILAMVADVRAVTIKIAERTIQMIALDTLDPEKKQGFMNETLNVYVPLAERLGFNLWKSQLQNLCFDGSPDLKSSYESITEYDEHGLAFKVKLEKALKEENLPYERVESRKKSLHSIQNKMSRKKYDFSKIRDIIGLRIIVENEEECYRANDVVGNLWEPEPKFGKDYIKNPKPDGYKSLHVCVKNTKDQYMEVQIRTNEMHMSSDEAHWLYKEGNLQVPEHVKMWVEFARLVTKQAKAQTITLGNSSPHRPRCPYANIENPPCLDANGDCKFPGERHVYVIVKVKNEVTVKQYQTGTLLRDLCLRRSWVGQVLINEAYAGLNYTLRAGDIVEFM